MSRVTSAAVAVAAVLVCLVPAAESGAQQQPSQQQQQQQDPNAPTGAAKVRTRGGHAIKLEEHQRAAIAVMFPRQGGQSIEVTATLVDPQNPAQAKELVFEGRNVQNGAVTASIDEGGAGRQLILAARRNGQDVPVQQIAGPADGASTLVVRREEPKQPDQPSVAQQPTPQQQPAQGAQANPGDPAAAAAQPAAAQQAPQQPEKPKPEPEKNDAVIFVYVRSMTQ